MRCLIQSIFSLNLLIKSRLKNPNVINPEMPRAFFSSLHSDDTRKQMPEMAKEQERRRIHLDEAGRIEFIGIAKQPSASGKSGQRCNRQDEKETACHHKTLRERHFPSGGRGGQQIGHRALIYQLGHQLGRQLHADDRQDEHQNQSVVFPGDERFGRTETVEPEGFADALRHRRNQIVDGFSVLAMLGYNQNMSRI